MNAMTELQPVFRDDKYPSRVYGRPALLERKDPVVYSTWSEDSGLTRSQSSFYEQNGYLHIEGFFTPEEVKKLKAEMQLLKDASADSGAREIVREPGGSEIRSIFAVHANNDVFRDLSLHHKLQRVVTHLLGGDVYVHQSRINFKRGFTGKEFYWHSDFETWHVEDGMPSMRALSCSIALDDNYHFNGPLMVVPGSHTTFVSCVGQTPDDHYKQSLRRQEYGVPDEESLTKLVKEGGIETPVGKAGSIVLFDCNIMHGSNSNITPYSRNNVFLVFNSVENRIGKPFSGQTPRPSFIATRERE